VVSDTHDRFHEVKVILPISEFLTCVGSYHYDEKPHIFVKDAWLSQLYLRSYSAFVMIDAVGVKKELRAGKLSRSRLIMLRDEIDALANRHPALAFVSLADSLVVKGNWSVGHIGSGAKYTYEPELFIGLIPEVQSIYAQVLGLHIYAIFTQGVNEYCEDAPTHVSNGGNHLCLNSLSLPFAQLLSIDEAARSAIRDGSHSAHELYLDEDFYHSLRFKYGFDKNAQPRAHYRDPMTGGSGHYFYGDCQRFLKNLTIEER